MRLVAHLVRKDLRAVAIVALVWIVLMAIEVAVQYAGVFAMARVPGRPRLPAMMLNFLPFAEVAVIVLIVSMVIHEDPLVDARAFWLTRPIPRGRLFFAKLMTIAVVIFVPALTALAILLASHHVPPVYMMRAGFEVVLWLGVPLMLSIAAATLTSTTSRYLLLLFGVLVALVTIVGFVASFERPLQVSAFLPRQLRVDDPTPEVTTALFLIAGLCAAIHQFYRRRDWLVALGGFVLVAGLATAMERYWPGYTFFAPLGAATGAWTNPSITQLRLLEGQTLVSAYHPRELRSIAAPLVLAGLPSGYTATPFTLNGQLTRADGTVLRSEWAPPMQVEAKGEYQPSLTLVYGNDPIDAGPIKWEAWPVLLELPPGHRGAIRPTVRGADASNPFSPSNASNPSNPEGGPAYYAGTYEGTFLYRIARHEKVAALRLDQREAYADGPRGIRIVEARDLGANCRVALEVTNTELTLAGPREPVAGYYFVDRQTGARLRASRWSTSSGMLGPLRIGLSPGRRIFTVAHVQWDVENPRDGSPGDVSSCSDTNLIFVRTISVGSLTRSITLPDFQVQPSQDTFFRR